MILDQVTQRIMCCNLRVINLCYLWKHCEEYNAWSTKLVNDLQKANFKDAYTSLQQFNVDRFSEHSEFKHVLTTQVWILLRYLKLRKCGFPTDLLMYDRDIEEVHDRCTSLSRTLRPSDTFAGIGLLLAYCLNPDYVAKNREEGKHYFIDSIRNIVQMSAYDQLYLMLDLYESIFRTFDETRDIILERMKFLTRQKTADEELLRRRMQGTQRSQKAQGIPCKGHNYERGNEHKERAESKSGPDLNCKIQTFMKEWYCILNRVTYRLHRYNRCAQKYGFELVEQLSVLSCHNSECGAELNRDTLRPCGSCGKVYYCDVICAQGYWQTHAEACKQVRTESRAYYLRWLQQQFLANIHMPILVFQFAAPTSRKRTRSMGVPKCTSSVPTGRQRALTDAPRKTGNPGDKDMEEVRDHCTSLLRQSDTFAGCPTRTQSEQGIGRQSVNDAFAHLLPLSVGEEIVDGCHYVEVPMTFDLQNSGRDNSSVNKLRVKKENILYIVV